MRKKSQKVEIFPMRPELAHSWAKSFGNTKTWSIQSGLDCPVSIGLKVGTNVAAVAMSVIKRPDCLSEPTFQRVTILAEAQWVSRRSRGKYKSRLLAVLRRSLHLQGYTVLIQTTNPQDWLTVCNAGFMRYEPNDNIAPTEPVEWISYHDRPNKRETPPPTQDALF